MVGPPALVAKVKFLMFFPLRDHETTAGPPGVETTGLERAGLSREMVIALHACEKNGPRDNETTSGRPASAAKVEFLTFFPLRDKETKAGSPGAETKD